ncbi:MAG: zinc-ribbon domain-containing protein [Planctomycetota bacterium]|jgi:predicted Zn finger-like uncharacterized protein
MKIQCPHCKAGFQIPEEHLGKSVKCTKCNPIQKYFPNRSFILQNMNMTSLSWFMN